MLKQLGKFLLPFFFIGSLAIILIMAIRLDGNFLSDIGLSNPAQTPIIGATATVASSFAPFTPQATLTRQAPNVVTRAVESPAFTPTPEPLPTSTKAAAQNETTEPPQAVITGTTDDSQVETELTLFADELPAEWQSWSWDAAIEVGTEDVQAGDNSLMANISAPWGGAYLHHIRGIKAEGYNGLRFWLKSDSAVENLAYIALADQSQTIVNQTLILLPANEWQLFEIPLSELGSPSTITGIVWQDATGKALPTFYIDQVALIFKEEFLPPTVVGAPLTVNVNNEIGAISPLIYGMNFAKEDVIQELGLPINRWGGNAATRYNYIYDNSNRASDWFFENIPAENPSPTLPIGSEADQFIRTNLDAGTASIMTMPLIGWTAKDGEFACAFPTSIYPNQAWIDPERGSCGNGMTTDNQPISGNNPTLTSAPIGPDFVQGWIEHLVGQFGSASNGGVAFYALDNEPMLWHHTHRDVHPETVSYDELMERSISYARAIKEADPTAQTLGPVTWGWSAYWWSARDLELSDNRPELDAPDREAHDGLPLTAYYLQEMAAASVGSRLLDYLDLHYYPQGQGVALSNAGNAETRALRLRSVKSLYDPEYVDESWIGEPIYLIPRMKQWVEDYYPGTKTALTEYNFGGLESINGALAQAEALGIFGREGLDLATIWSPPKTDQPGLFAFHIYRNYDGNGSQFGDIGLEAISSNVDELAIFAARRSTDQSLTILVINKQEANVESEINLNGGNGAASAQPFQYSPLNLTQIVPLPAIPIEDGTIAVTLPASSITLFVIE